MLSSQHSRSGTTPARGNTNLSADSQPPLPTSAAVAQGAPDQLVQVVRGLRERVKELEDNISELKRENNQKMVEMEHRWNSEFQALKGTLLSEVKLLTAKAQGKETRPSSNEERQVTAADDGPEKGSRGLNSQRRQDHYVGHRPDRSDGRDEKNSGMPFQTRSTSWTVPNSQPGPTRRNASVVALSEEIYAPTQSRNDVHTEQGVAGPSYPVIPDSLHHVTFDRSFRPPIAPLNPVGVFVSNERPDRFSNDWRLVCDVCNIKFDDRKGLTSHRNNTHGRDQAKSFIRGHLRYDDPGAHVLREMAKSMNMGGQHADLRRILKEAVRMVEENLHVGEQDARAFQKAFHVFSEWWLAYSFCTNCERIFARPDALTRHQNHGICSP